MTARKGEFEEMAWSKACRCSGSASTNRLRVSEKSLDVDGVVIDFAFHFGPSCDQCGTPWKRKEKP